MNLSPVLTMACPLFGYVHGCQIQHFQQTVIGRKYHLAFRYLSQLAVESLHGIRCVNQPPDCFRILEMVDRVAQFSDHDL